MAGASRDCGRRPSHVYPRRLVSPDVPRPMASSRTPGRMHTPGSAGLRKSHSSHSQADWSPFHRMGFGVGTLKWERWPERYKGGAHFPSLDESKEWIEKWDARGLVHTVMTFGGHFIGGLCNCDYPGCILIQSRLDYGVEPVCLKGHQVAKVDHDICIGCQTCISRCQFGAIRFEPTMDRVIIDALKCYGCGLCQTGCPQEAINLLDRKSIPALKDVW